MCGIFGIYSGGTPKVGDAPLQFRKLILASLSRGQDSSGVLAVESDTISILKQGCSGRNLLTDREYVRQWGRTESFPVFAMGHCRMETNGSFVEEANNQPVLRGDWIGIHNGIFVNDEEVWRRHPELHRHSRVDTEVLLALLEKNVGNSPELKLVEAWSAAMKELKGSYSLAVMNRQLDGVVLATNTGSLHYVGRKGYFAFASERTFLKEALECSVGDIQSIELETPYWLDLRSGDFSRLSKESVKPLKRNVKVLQPSVPSHTPPPVLMNHLKRGELDKIVHATFSEVAFHVRDLKRCTKCILPVTMPFIYFDEKGVCNYCLGYEPRNVKGIQALHRDLENWRRKLPNQGSNSILSFSGGRDSSYALHYVVRELGLKPLAFSYDWGMLTDLGRRNQARMTGQLGIEHILVAANIQKKREYIRKNVAAWLDRPHVGMVPLFMAGDKHYFSYLNRLREQSGIPLSIYAENSLEATYFKYGFAGVKIDPVHKVKKAYSIGRMNSVKLLGFYAGQYLTHPRYLNSSLWDTFTAYWSSYFVPKDHFYLFQYIAWDEETVEKTLVEQYDWELAPDTKSSWRIGDGTAAFYNTIYYWVKGLTEHETFRSNQIREGLIDRKTALERAAAGNQPRMDSLIWYFDTIGLDALDAVKKIVKMKRFYQE